jgi:protein N-terminal amidase
MKVACLQFAPELGKVKENIERADRLLEASAAELRTPQDGRSLWLVLPEMAFSGIFIPHVPKVKHVLTTESQATTSNH